MPQLVHKGKSKRLDLVLGTWLSKETHREVSRAQIRKLLVGGFVYLDGRIAKTGTREVSDGSKLEVSGSALEKMLPENTEVSFEFQDKAILFEDDDLILVNKPYGVPTQPTLDPGRKNLFDEVKKFLKQRDGHEYLGLHHRLDRDTTGIVLFAKSRRVNRGIATQFSSHSLRKTYQTLCFAVNPQALDSTEWQISNHLGRDKRKHNHLRPRTHVFHAVNSGGQSAQTHFKILKKRGRAAWVEAQPVTGRTHQIRVHLAEYGMPILGDRIYGGIHGDEKYEESNTKEMLLHAGKIAFVHPVTEVELEVTCDLPKNFKRQLKALKLT